MAKPAFANQYTALQKRIIGRLAAIEQSDADACANCGGEDCCCEIYLDRQRWVSPDELFDDMRDWPEYQDEAESECCGDCASCPTDGCGSRDADYQEHDTPEDDPAQRRKPSYPCDGPDGQCPYISDDNDATNMYFCRDHCGLGVDECGE